MRDSGRPVSGSKPSPFLAAVTSRARYDSASPEVRKDSLKELARDDLSLDG